MGDAGTKLAGAEGIGEQQTSEPLGEAGAMELYLSSPFPGLWALGSPQRLRGTESQSEERFISTYLKNHQAILVQSCFLKDDRAGG